MLDDGGLVPPGVHLPAELGPDARAAILRRAKRDAFVWDLSLGTTAAGE
jgi:hypothetical protein